ncbi:MAG: Sec-independent protein translocase protein TatB [Sulfurovum sp.]|nr:Sec-independent protein translocase protein TatB [Sulfurovum sp.]
MFGIGFTELLLISVIAILFLGPDKLPEALVDMAKFIKSVKKTITDAKDSFEEEIKLNDLKEEALTYKKQLDDATAELKSFKNISLDDFDNESYDDEVSDISPMEHVKATQNASKPYAEAPREANKDTSKNTEKDMPKEISSKESNVEPKNTTVTFKKKKKTTTKKEDKMKSKDDN